MLFVASIDEVTFRAVLPDVVVPFRAVLPDVIAKRRFAAQLRINSSQASSLKSCVRAEKTKQRKVRLPLAVLSCVCYFAVLFNWYNLPSANIQGRINGLVGPWRL